MVFTTSTQTVATSPARRARLDVYGILFWILLLLFELFVFTLPLFPNGDGPVHIYLSSIFWKLVTHSSPLYEHFYAVRHLVQPYSFHYYLFILLEHGMPVDMAEKCFVGIIWATLAIGFRTLAYTLAASGSETVAEIVPEASAASLLIFPLLFNWPLSAGFFNFTFGCGLLLFALAYYTRLGSPGKAGTDFAALFVTLVLLVLAHPIPLMVVIFLIGMDLGLQLLAGRQSRQPLRLRRLRLPPWQAAAFGLACVAFVFPVLIADTASVAGTVSHFRPHFYLLRPLLSGITVSFFNVSNGFGRLYQGLIVLMPLTGVLLFLRSGLSHRLRSGFLSSADRLLCSSLLFLLATLAFPESMNGSALFAVRMWFPVWLLVMACLAAILHGKPLENSVAGFSMALAGLSLVFGLVYLRPVARRQAQLEQAPLPYNARGLFIQPLNATAGKQTHTWWALSFWDGVRAFSAHDDVLLNTPWLQLTIVPVRENGHAGLMRDVTPNGFSEDPSSLQGNLELLQGSKAAALRQADFLLAVDPDSAQPDPLGFAAGFLGPFGSQWNCTRHDFYAICIRR